MQVRFICFLMFIDTRLADVSLLGFAFLGRFAVVKRKSGPNRPKFLSLVNCDRQLIPTRNDAK